MLKTNYFGKIQRIVLDIIQINNEANSNFNFYYGTWLQKRIHTSEHEKILTL